MSNEKKPMDAREEALSLLSDALDDEAFARRESQKRYRQLKREFVEKRQSTLDREVSAWSAAQSVRADRMRFAVEDYLRAAAAAAQNELKGDVRMPYLINYRERYKAFCKMQNVDQLLARIDQTLNLADRVMANAGRVDVQQGVSQSTAAYREAALLLGGIEVAAPREKDVQEELLVEADRASDVMQQRSDKQARSVEAVIESAFEMDAVSGDGGLGDDFDEDALTKRFGEELSLARKKARQLAVADVRLNAQKVVGKRLDCSCVGCFGGTVCAKLRYDLDGLKALSAEVRKSFETYTRVVREGGVFSAFSRGADSFGACNVRSWAWMSETWGFVDDDETPSAAMREQPSHRANVVTGVAEEGEEGDGLAKAVERMREFNAVKYWGMLDDDYDKHVDWFWYGFKKLMEFVNSMFEVDCSAVDLYQGQVRIDLTKQAHQLGLFMDEGQVSDFAKSIRQLQDGSGVDPA